MAADNIFGLLQRAEIPAADTTPNKLGLENDTGNVMHLKHTSTRVTHLSQVGFAEDVIEHW